MKYKTILRKINTRKLIIEVVNMILELLPYYEQQMSLAGVQRP